MQKVLVPELILAYTVINCCYRETGTLLMYPMTFSEFLGADGGERLRIIYKDGLGDLLPANAYADLTDCGKIDV